MTAWWVAPADRWRASRRTGRCVDAEASEEGAGRPDAANCEREIIGTLQDVLLPLRADAACAVGLARQGRAERPGGKADELLCAQLTRTCFPAVHSGPLRTAPQERDERRSEDDRRNQVAMSSYLAPFSLAGCVSVYRLSAAPNQSA